MWLTPDLRATFHVRKIHPDPDSDLALLELEPAHALPTNYAWQHLHLDLAPPPLGATVAAIGYPGATVGFEADGRARIDGHAIASGGQVGELLPRGRGDRDMPHPSFLVYAQWDDNMSGAPVINASGQVCGVVCRGSTTAPGVGPFAYASMLWPLLVCRIVPHRPIPGVPAGPVLVRDLFAHQAMSGIGWDEVLIATDPERPEMLMLDVPEHFAAGRAR